MQSLLNSTKRILPYGSTNILTRTFIQPIQDRRIYKHPVLEIPEKKKVDFTWNGVKLQGYEGEALSSSLIANGQSVFGFHTRDGSPQGIFCANGQCSQCMVVVDGLSKKSCMIPLKEGMDVKYAELTLPKSQESFSTKDIPTKEVEVLIIGGGPSGLSASIELGKQGVDVLCIDDKDRFGGKLVLQTHKFFGSSEECYAGTRGYRIGEILEKEVRKYESVTLKNNSTALAVYSDQTIGILTNGKYELIKPKKLLVATGAREKFLSFPGNTLPGVYGAGAFQTLVNRDLVKCSDKVMIVGGGNVGLIGGYHAIQAGIEVVGLVEALPECGGYKVHEDKLRRLGVPIMTRHTIVEAKGDGKVEQVVIAKLDDNWNIIEGTYQTYDVDTILLAVGLEECREFTEKAKKYGLDVYSAGDAQEIAEASAAMFTGKIAGRKILKSLGKKIEIPEEWEEKAEILKSKPGEVQLEREQFEEDEGFFPVFHCFQDIPCDACTAACNHGNIETGEEGITEIPQFLGEVDDCDGCLKCVSECPGLAVTLVDYNDDSDNPIVTFPYEIWQSDVKVGSKVEVMDDFGATIGRFPVERIITRGETLLVSVRMPSKYAKTAASVVKKIEKVDPQLIYEKKSPKDSSVVCRCERITAGEIRKIIQDGARDMNQIKIATRAGMGACGSKTCNSVIGRIFREEGIPPEDITPRVMRPLYVEVSMGAFAGLD
ncbi:anaerobic glycerol-3-phosphate dehydrogenase subunit b [Anaeramoeba flamelloides]|uniref:Anaerobic glycerol-3-phosphate dehydrogenase subunit b n=1 Tax=Anaeramoeba flamelloides TaxID=1746091 RepID=A0AAV7ZP99_9EUKA|nr:anaerobic glycerol-3-phosphate dehydrogenase subunit b [Anaeramoeba flamelloides]